MDTPSSPTGEIAMTHLSIDLAPEAVKRFFETLSLKPEGSVVEMNGKPMARMLPANAAIAADPGPWTPEKNRRRCDLVDQKFATGLTPAEANELESLTAGMRHFIQRVAPVPLDEVRRQHDRLFEVAAESDRRA